MWANTSTERICGNEEKHLELWSCVMMEIKRDWNVDALRVLSMLMVVCLHFLAMGD